MKSKVIFGLATLMLATSCAESVDYNSVDVFINATYTVADRMKSVEYANQRNYEEFDFTYIFASPRWKVEDFDLTQEQINKIYIEEFAYEKTRDQSYVTTLISNIHKNRDKKILCSFNGSEIVEIASNKSRQAKFAKMVASFIEKHNYDGVEVDWEHTITIPMHLEFIKAIRAELDALDMGKQLYLTTALHSTHKYTKAQADELSKYVDWVNIMTYDMGGGCWGVVPSHNTPLDVMKQHLTYWEEFDPKKICIGLANYGFYYTDLSPNEKLTDGENLSSCGVYYAYNDMQKLFDAGWSEEWDAQAECPYYFSPDREDFVTMDNLKSLEAKVEWIKEMGYKGLFWWEFHLDWKAPTNLEDRGTHTLVDEVTKMVK